jgi:CBS domain containing-hemolysin-like protein
VDFVFWLELILFVLLLGFSAFFSSSETAMFSLNQIHLEQMRQDGNPRVELIERMLSEPRRLIVTILIGNEFVNVAASVLSAAMVIEVFGEDNKLFNLFIMVPMLLIVGEITPKTLAIRNNIAFASFESQPINFFARLITPVRLVVRHTADFFTTLIVGSERSRGNLITEDMVRTLAREAVGEGALDKSEARFIDRIFEFGSKTLDEVQTPRADIEFIPINSPVSAMLDIVRETRQSRYPVYGEHRDDIIGILHARDLLSVDIDALEHDHSRFRELLRQPHFVPESKPAHELFDSFRENKRSFALTVDEYGGVTGLVTMEDLLECIFGDIPSPSDQADIFEFRRLADNSYVVDGAMPLDEFNLKFNTRVADSDMETIGGLVLVEFGELPPQGAKVTIGRFSFTATRVDHNRIEQLQVEVKPKADDHDNQARTPATSIDVEQQGQSDAH